MSTLTNFRVLHHQHTETQIMEIIEGPDGRRVQLYAQSRPDKAYSQLWTDQGWVSVYQLLELGASPQDSITLLFQPTEDILGWSKETL